VLNGRLIMLTLLVVLCESEAPLYTCHAKGVSDTLQHVGRVRIVLRPTLLQGVFIGLIGSYAL